MADNTVICWGLYSIRDRRRVLNMAADKKKPAQDTRKEQASLALGSPEYLEYVEDLQTHKPEADEMHEELEVRNAVLPEELDEDSKELTQSDKAKLIRKQTISETKKRGLIGVSMATARAIAKSTPGDQDDRNVEAIGRMLPDRFNKLIQDASVDEATFQKKAVDDALSGPGKYC